MVSIFITYILIAYGSLGLFANFDLNFVQRGTMMCACFNVVSLIILTFTDTLAEEFKGVFKMFFVQLVNGMLISFMYEWKETWLLYVLSSVIAMHVLRNILMKRQIPIATWVTFDGLLGTFAVHWIVFGLWSSIKWGFKLFLLLLPLTGSVSSMI